MATSSPDDGRLTEAEFLALPESLEKIELLDGEVIVSPSPTHWHQEVLRRLLLELGLWARGSSQAVTIGQSPRDVRFRPGRILQPDAFVVLERVPLRLEGPLDRVPALCIEVLSANRVYDRVTKRLVYAEAGVREGWLVEPAAFVERWTGDNLALAEEVRTSLTSPLLPGFTLEVSTLFAE